jgi:hypothetical protein
MAVTRLVRKALRNRAVSSKRVNNIKRLTAKPVIKNVDIEQIKEEFANKKAKQATKKEAPVKEEAKAVVDTPIAGNKEKEAPKAETTAPKTKTKKKDDSGETPVKKEESESR